MNQLENKQDQGNNSNAPDRINLSINDGDAFFAHQVSMNFSPNQFFIDFKSANSG